MSEDNGNKEEEKDPLTEEFDFYFSFTKPLVLDLPSSEDRAIAAAWVQKVEAEPETEEDKELRLNYLKLLLFVLQRGRLSGIFKKQPPSGPLQPFPQGFSIFDMGNWMLEQDDGQSNGAGDARSVPYNIDMSNDLREFIATQEIPNFGIQMYYAWSSEDPIHKWIAFDEEKFPQFILDKIKQLKEIKSEEKNAVGKGTCLKKKKICDFSLPEKSSKKRVKSPQEIERSQGRSFHTYLGLVGRMGNFNDKCDEDPEKFPRQEQRRAKCKNRSPQKKCPGNGGGAEDMAGDEDYDNGACGTNGQRMAFCGPQNGPPPNCGRQDYSEAKGASSSTVDCPSGSRKGFTIRADVEINQSGPKACAPKRRMDDQCPNMDMPQMTPQRGSPRSRTTSPSRGLDCAPPDDKSGGLPKQTGVCICSSPRCSCPCRSLGRPQEATSNANSSTAGGRPPPDACRTMTKSPRPDIGPPEMMGGAACASIKTPDATVGSNRIGNSSGGRMASPPGRNGGPLEVVHCYDNRSVDPALFERVDKQYMDARECGSKRTEADYQNIMAREQQIKERQAQFPTTPRRGVFKPLAHSTPIMPNLPTDVTRNAAGYCPPGPRMPSPAMEMYTSLDYPPIEQTQRTYIIQPNQQQFQQQNFGEFEAAEAACPRMRSPGKKSPPQAVNTSKPCPSAAPGPSDNGRMANMVNMLQDMKLKTEAHREKCETAARRSPAADAAYQGNGQPSPQAKARPPMGFDNGQMPAACSNQPRNMRSQQMFYSPQAKAAQQFSPIQDRGYSSLPCSMPNKPCPTASQLRQPMRSVCPSSAGPEMFSTTYDDTDNTYEDTFDIDSSDSLDLCSSEPAPPPAPPPSPLKQIPQQCPRPMPTAIDFSDVETTRDSPQWGPMKQVPVQESPRPGPSQECPRPMPAQECPRPMPAQESPRPMPAQECSRPVPGAMDFGSEMNALPPGRDTPVQWVTMNATGEMTRNSQQRDFQGTMLEVDGRVCRRGPQRASPQRTSPPRSCPRPSPGRNVQQDNSTDFGGLSPILPDTTGSSKRTWATSATMGSRTPDLSNATWMALQQQCPTNERSKGQTSALSPDMRSNDMSSVKWVTPVGKPWPPPESCPRGGESAAIQPGTSRGISLMHGSPRPPQNVPCPSQNGSCPPSSAPCPLPPNGSCPPQQRSPVNYGPQQMNAEYQDDLGADDMAQDNMIDEDYEPTLYTPLQSDCANDPPGGTYIVFDDDFNQNPEPQNMDCGEEGYDDFQDVEEELCEPMPAPPQNCPANRSMGGSRSRSPNQSQRAPNGSPNNMTQSTIETFCGMPLTRR